MYLLSYSVKTKCDGRTDGQTDGREAFQYLPSRQEITKMEELTAEGIFNQGLLRNIDCYLRIMCCKVDRKIQKSS